MSVIYILKHPKNRKVCKIGESSIGARSRTAYQGINWQVYREFPIAAHRRLGAERFIHKKLDADNSNIGGEGAREIFTIPPAGAVQQVEALLGEFLSKVAAKEKDDDYWNYVATPSERARHEQLIALERAREEQRRAEEERNERLRKDREAYTRLVERIRTHQRHGWFNRGCPDFCV